MINSYSTENEIIKNLYEILKQEIENTEKEIEKNKKFIDNLNQNAN